MKNQVRTECRTAALPQNLLFDQEVAVFGSEENFSKT